MISLEITKIKLEIIQSILDCEDESILQECKRILKEETE